MYQSVSTLQLKIAEVYPWKKIFAIIGISLISGIPVFALLSFNLPDLVLLVLSAIIYGLLFLYSSFKLKIWGESEIKLIKSFWVLKNS